MLIAGIFGDLLRVFFHFIQYVADLIVQPIFQVIDDIINQFINSVPALKYAIWAVDTQLFGTLERVIPFAVSYLGLSTSVINIIVALISIIIMIPLAVHGIKVALRWYRILMP